MLLEEHDGTRLEPFLDEFRRSPRHLSIIDLFDDLFASDLISLTDLILSSRHEIVVRKSDLIKHFDEISFLRQRDVDRLAQSTLVIREDQLNVLLDQRAEKMKNLYIKMIFDDEQRKEFIDEHLNQSNQRLTSLTIYGESNRIDCFSSQKKFFRIYSNVQFESELCEDFRLDENCQ